MAEKLSLRTNANGDIYVYIEDSAGASLAFGADSANGVVALNTLGMPNVEPLQSTANLTIDPTANGDILFRPHGSGKSEFNTGNVQITAGNLTFPSTASGLTEGAILWNSTVLQHAYGVQNFFIGESCGNTTLNVGAAQGNYAIGILALQDLTTGSGNNVHGWSAGTDITSGIRNDLVGYQAGTNITQGHTNVMIGYLTGFGVTTGSNNTLLGSSSGSNYTGTESSNIIIKNVGSAADNNVIRIGTQGAGAGQQNRAFMAGIHGVTPAGAGQQLMVMDNVGQMGTSTGGSLFASSFATDAGTATPAAGVITIAGGLNITTSGAASTVTVNVGEIVGVTNSGASTVPYIATGTGQLGTVPGGAVLMNTGTQSLSISSDASATTVAIATGAAVKGLTLGSTNSTSSSTLQSGSGALAVTSTNGTLTVNSGTGALSVSSDASATVVDLATGAAAKTVTLGSVTTTSSLALKYGTADFTLASATGTVMSALDTGEINYPLQPAFFAHLASAANNVTGAGAVYTLGTAALTIVFDQNGDMNTNGTFTAPVTGRYNFSGQVLMIGCTIATTGNLRNNTSNRVYFGQFARAAGAQNMLVLNTTITDMDAGDTTTLSIQVTGEAGSTVDMSSGSGGGPDCWLSGFLVC